MTVAQRFRRSWTSWSLKRMARKQQKAQRRLELLQLETTHQLLRVKELSQAQVQLEHRQRELTEAEQWYRAGTPPMEKLVQEPALTPLQMLLGPSETPPNSPTTGEQ